jgi:chorismate mutase
MNLETIRKEIDSIDQQIIELLIKRFEKALQTKQFKKTTTDKTREEEVLDAVRRAAKYPLREEFAIELYRKIISESKKLQEEN